MLSEIHLTIDPKRRIAIPTRFRKELGKSVVITRHFDGCLNVYPKKLWDTGTTKAQEINKRLLISEKHRKLSRFLTSGEQVEIDASGRILIPEHMATFAELKDAVVFVGTEEGFQLWGHSRWAQDGMPSIDEVKSLAESEEFQKLNEPR